MPSNVPRYPFNQRGWGLANALDKFKALTPEHHIRRVPSKPREISRMTLTMPAWVLVSVRGQLDSAVAANMVPSAARMKRSTIEPATTRSPSPSGSRT
jgi:hypothetical protein